MASYADWLEETIGFAEEDFLLDEHTEAKDSGSYGDPPYSFEGDAVLCLVDCRSEMFSLSTQTHHSIVQPNQKGEHRFEGEKCNLSTPLTSSFQDVNVSCQDMDSTFVHLTPFHRALHGVSSLYRNISISNNNDVLALVLYNTAVQKNTYGCPGVYISNSFSELDISNLHAIEQLATAAADPGSDAYKEFVQEVGHLPAHHLPVLSEALRAAHCMFSGLGTKPIKRKCIFVFTNDDDPTQGNTPAHDQCITCFQVLVDMGVFIEVLGVGERVVEGVAPTSAATTATAIDLEHNRQSATTPRGISAGEHTFLSRDNNAFMDNVDNAVPLGCAFWKRLLYEFGKRSPQADSLGTGELTFHNCNRHTGCHDRTVGIDRTLGCSFEGFLESIGRKIHPQRPFMNCKLFIGVCRNGVDMPHMAVSLYSPLLHATDQSTGWMEAATKAPINRRVVLKANRVNSISCGDGSDGGKPHTSEAEHYFEESVGWHDNCTNRQDVILSPKELRYSAQIGGSTIIFTPEEQAKLVRVAAAGGKYGLTIVCFKLYEDVIQHKHSVHHSAFVHANLSEGGHNSLRLFVQLVRTLRAQGKVAIAQYVMKNIPPRLMALVPSPDFTLFRQHTIPETSMPTQGLGFFMVPLPYADDIHPVPDLAVLPSCIKGVNPRLSPDAVSETDIQLARRVIDALSVRYDILAVPNPSLQLRHRLMEDLVLRQPTFPMSGQVEGEPLLGTSPSATSPTGCKDSEAVCVALTTVRDWTLPDKAFMVRHAKRFQDFNAFVLGSSYDAEKMCGQPRTTAGASRRPRAYKDNASDKNSDTWGKNPAPIPDSPTRGEYNNYNQSEIRGVYTADEIKELVGAAADRNAWHRLTIVQLKEYLKTIVHTTGYGKNKDALIQIAKDAYLKGDS
ncbi:unnamed protein product [Phytomonas sp. Hart1]|nr:unnamed protein product [Phytomonas sp. Hart1]|eukprot:CCW67394.1 unnamed protein product [Phytomonas sp. isolate Hart1]